MRANYVGNARLRALVDEGLAVHVPEVVAVDGEDIKDLKSEWDAASTSGGSVEILDAGGARLNATGSTLISPVTNDGTDVTRLTFVPPFDAVLVTWSALHAHDYEITSLVARLDPRDDGGSPKTVSEFRAQLFRVAEYVGESTVLLAPISREVVVDAAGEAPDDFTFSFRGEGFLGGDYPKVGEAPIGGSFPQTLIRIIALQDDGTVADNVTWLSSAGATASGSGWSADAVELSEGEGEEGTEERGGAIYFVESLDRVPEFTLSAADYTAATITFSGSGVEVEDISGSGELTVVARGYTPSDSSLTFEIFNGSSWIECFDGDVLGEDNSAQGGGDLSTVSTTGPWDMRVTLTPSTAADLNTPIVRELGIERVTSTFLTGAAELRGDVRQIDPLSLVGNIARAELRVLKTGDPDHRDYGSNVIAENHIGDIYLRVWVADSAAGRDGAYLDRSEWMEFATYDIDDYFSTDTEHVFQLLSPLRRLKTLIPPFVVVSGNDGTRTEQQISGTLKAAYEEIVDSQVGLAGRFRGPGIEDSTNTVSKIIRRSDAKKELDQLAFLDGSSLIESQGRIRTVKVIRGEAGGDSPLAYFPLGSYEPVGGFGPGYTTRIDEYFVLYNYNEIRDFFEDERRYVNATALDKLGGVGLGTTESLDEDIAKWISTQAVADAVGNRTPAHFGNGLIVWRIRSNARNPHLEIGDAVAIETRDFVARSPINSQEIRGRVTALATIVKVGDPWGQTLDLWVPSFDKIVLGTGTVTGSQFPFGVVERDISSRTHTGDTNETTLHTYTLPGGAVGENGILRIFVAYAPSGGNGNATLRIKVDGTLFGAALLVSADATQRSAELIIDANDSESSQSVTFNYVSDGTSPGQLVQTRSVDLSADVDITVTGELANAGDTFSISRTLIELLGSG